MIENTIYYAANLKKILYNTSAEMPKPNKKLQADQVVVAQKNRFAALDDFSSDSDDDAEPTESAMTHVVEKASPIQVVETPVETNTSREFTIVHKRGKQISTDKDGWTSIQWSKPQFVDSDTESQESETQIQKELEAEALECDIDYADDDVPPIQPVTDPFPSLLNRGSINTVAWAEKIKQSLEKAETNRKTPVAPGIKPTEDFVAALGGISFFGPKA